MADKKVNNEEYEPYDHRTPVHPTTNIESWLHIVKAVVGTGILAMPDAFKNAGMFLGVVGCMINGGLCTYGIHLLVGSQYLLCKKVLIGSQTYAESMVTACEVGPKCSQKLSKYASGVTDAFIIIYQIGCCCVYVLFVCKNVKYVCDELFSQWISTEMYMALLFIPFFLVNSLRNLKVLVPLSMIANIITIVTIGIVFYFLFAGGLPPITDRPIFVAPYRLPLFFGTTNFAFQSVAVVSAVEYNMMTPKSFGGYFGVYNLALAPIMLLYTALGLLGYWKYGEKTAASITLNLPPMDILTKLVNLLYAFAIFSSFGLNAIVPIELVWRFYIGKYLDETRWALTWQYFLRLAVVVISFVLPVTIPFLSIFISFLGCIVVSFLIFIFPSWMDMCVRFQDRNYGSCSWRLWKDLLLVMYGFVGLVTGVTLNVIEIVNELSKTSASKK